MLQNMIEEAKSALRHVARSSGLVAALALTSFATLCFLCAAGFVAVLDRYGLIAACLAGAAFFFLLAIFILIWLDGLRRRARQPKEATKSAMQTALADPMVIAAALQLVRVIGIKRLIPLIALGGIALGLMAKPPAGRREKN